MSEEVTSESEPQEKTVGNSLLDSLFAAAESEESAPQVEEEVETEFNPSEPLALTDIINEPESIQVEEEEPKPEPEPEAKEEEEPRNLEKFDKDLFEGGLPDPREVEPEPEPKSEPEPEPEPELEPEIVLTEDQDKRYQLAKFAEENFSEHKGLAKQYLDFFEEQKKYIDERLIEDPEAKFDETDYEYQNFLQRKKPKFSQDDLEKVIEKRTMSRAKQETISELTPEIEKLKEQQRILRVEPAVNKLKEATRESIKDLIPEGMREVIDSKGSEAAYEQNPVEFDIVDKVATFHQGAMFAFHEISSGLKKFDPTDDTHIRLATWLDNLQHSMPEKDGKKFVRREDFGKLSSKEKSKSYTLTDSDVVSMAHDSAKLYITNELNANEERLRKSGYVRSQGAVSQSVEQTPRQPKPAPRQGHNVNQEAQGREKANPVLSALGL
jgi:hypothetical protein